MPTVTIQPIGSASKDASVTEGAPNNNYATGVLSVGEQPDFLSIRVCIEFDLIGAGVPAGSTITDAILTLHRYLTQDGNPGPTEITFDRTTAAWVEATITWANQPATAGASFAIARSGVGDGDENYTGASMVSAAQDALDNRTGIWSYKLEADGQNAVLWRSGEYSGGSHVNRPKLAITYGQPVNLPTVVTTAATGITHNDATVGGDVTDDGGAAVTEKGIVYSFGVLGNLNVVGPEPFLFADGIGEGSWTTTFFAAQGVPGMPGMIVYYRAYALNANGYGYGETLSFSFLNPTAHRRLRGIGI